MNTESFPLDAIAPNPYQVRLADDAEHVRSLAESIARDGLLQVPTGRRVGKDIQLAFGHSRLAAYRQLSADDRAGGGDGEAYSTFPVIVRELTDRQMSDLAASENARRKNLTAIEMALALRRRKKDFQLNNAEAGAPFGLGEAAVSNLLRLLDLPADVQAQVDAGEVPQRLARQLVNVARTDPQAAQKIAKAIAGAPAASREEALADAMAAHLRGKLSLGEAPWQADWLDPAYSLAVPALDGVDSSKTVAAHALALAAKGARQAGLSELRACAGCPHRLVFGVLDYCTLAACFRAKHALFDLQAARRVSDRTGIPLAAKGEQVTPLPKVLSDGSYGYYSDEPKVARLKSAFKAQPELGLRVVAGDTRGWFWEHALKEKRVALATVAPAAVKAFLKAAERAPDKPAQSANGKAPTAAAAARSAQRAAEEAAAEKRREARAAWQRELHDCSWLVGHVTPGLAAQLTIRGPVLAYVVQRLRVELHHAADYPGGLGKMHGDLVQRAQKAKGDEREGLLRQALVAGEVITYCVQMPYPMETRKGRLYRELRQAIEALATTGIKERYLIGGRHLPLGVKLPPDWDRPPVHRTPWNCWHCGAFTGAERVTQRDVTAGWLVHGKAGSPEGVWCGAAHRAAFIQANANEHKPAKKAKA